MQLFSIFNFLVFKTAKKGFISVCSTLTVLCLRAFLTLLIKLRANNLNQRIREF